MKDVLVVGAGVVGLACAYALRRRGLSVLVVDRAGPGSGASSGNAGWIVPCFSGPVPAPAVRAASIRWLLRPDSPLYIKPRPDPGLLRWLWSFWRHCNRRDFERGLAAVARLNARTMALFDALLADGVAFELERRGVLFLFQTEAAARGEWHDLKRVERFGFAPPVWLDRAALRDELPAVADTVSGGILAPEERHVRPESLVRGLVARLRELGVEVRGGVETRGFRRRAGRVAGIETAAGPIEAGHVVLAAGVGTRDLARRLGARLPLEGGKGYSVTFEPPPLPVRRPLYLAESRVAVTPFAAGLRLAGTMELSGLDPRLSARRVGALSRSTARYLRGWPAAASPHAWAGFRPMAPDGLPIIGPLPGAENVLIATGHAMLGVTLAPATGEAVADLVAGEADRRLLAPFSPARFSRRGASG